MSGDNGGNCPLRATITTNIPLLDDVNGVLEAYTVENLITSAIPVVNGDTRSDGTSKSLGSTTGTILDFSVEDAVKVKNTEKITNHDVKAIEYFVKEKLEAIGLKDYQEFVHFGLTSEDVNSSLVSPKCTNSW